MKIGECVIWFHSPSHSIAEGWRVEKTSGEIVRIGPRRIRIRVRLRGKERYVNVSPENLLYETEE